MFLPHCSMFGFKTVQVSYVRNQVGLFEVTALDSVTIVVFPATMRRVLGIDPRTSVGCAEITGLQAELIGFIVPKRNQKRKAVAV